MALNCRITRNEEGKIEDVLAPNNKKSILYNSLLSFYNGDENQALTAYALTETEELKRMMSYEKVKHLKKVDEVEIEDVIQFQKQLVQNRTGYYSNATASLENLKDKNPKNVKGWTSQLTDTQKNGGIKNVNQELEWIGLEDYLNDYVKENNPKAGNIPFSVVEDYIKSNQIEIVDVTKTTNKPRITEEDIIDAYEYNGDNGWVIRVDFEDGAYVDVTSEETEDIEEAKKIAVSEYNLSIPVLNTKGDTKYSGYQLKGAENYREILLTMPSKLKSSVEEYKKTLREQSELEKKLGLDTPTKEQRIEYERLSSKLADLKYNFGDRVSIGNYGIPQIKEEYKSSHWDEKNIIAHVRLNEKTLPDGRRVLILNEIQADISQDLKKEQDKILDRVDKEFDNFLDNLIMNKVIIEEC